MQSGMEALGGERGLDGRALGGASDGWVVGGASNEMGTGWG